MLPHQLPTNQPPTTGGVARCSVDAAGLRFAVTGAAGLIGRRLVANFAAAGAEVLALDHAEESLTDAAQRWPSTVRPIVVDLADPVAIERLADDPDFGAVNVLVNNAAVTYLRDPLLDTTATTLDLIHAVNYRATVLLSQLVVRRWQAVGISGCIINISSPGAARAHEDQAAYDASKGAIEAITRAMAVEWGRLGVRVNALAPASVGDGRRAVTDAPLGWSATGDDVAAASLWLASDAAVIVTGHVLALDGGLLARLRTATEHERTPA